MTCWCTSRSGCRWRRSGPQAAFEAGIDSFLAAGGGLVVFHHGAYLGPGKAGIQERVGATATGDVPFDTVTGQTVINVSPGHFVTSWSVEYDTTIAYDDNGTRHLLGFTHRRPEWSGVVVGYQPGEYQPNALDDLAGNNFQILANAIVYAAGQAPAPVPSASSGARLGLATLLTLSVGTVLARLGRARES
jgi:hypothetical protein